MPSGMPLWMDGADSDGTCIPAQADSSSRCCLIADRRRIAEYVPVARTL